MRRTLLTLVCAAVACAPLTEPPPTIPPGSASAGQLELALRPGGPRVYTLRLRDRAVIERRGPGPGRAHYDLDVRAKLSRSDQAAGDGVRVDVAFSGVDARTYGPLGRNAAAAARALEGAKVALTVDSMGAVQSFAFEGSARARTLAERLGRAFVKMTPAFARGGRAPGGRWGESMTLPLELADGSTPTQATLQASYVYQRGGSIGGRPCAVVQVDLKPGGNTTTTGAVEGAVNASGTGRGELCLDVATGALLAGHFDLSLRTEVGARVDPSSRVRPLHLDETRRVRIDVVESLAAAAK